IGTQPFKQRTNHIEETTLIAIGEMIYSARKTNKTMTKKLGTLTTLLFTLMATQGAGPVHGPICSWHLDPTSTITIQWIEKVDAILPHGRWLEAHAGFGYGDPKNLSHVKMQDEVRSLYIRKPFEVEDLDGGTPVKLAGKWKSVAVVNAIDIQTTSVFTWDKSSKSYKGTISSILLGKADFDKVEIAGQNLNMEFKLDYLGKNYTVNVGAKESQPGKLEGKYTVFDSNGKKEFDDDWKADLLSAGDVPPDSKVYEAVDADTKLVLKARHSDGFIAYLNGDEILRVNVDKGSGDAVEGVTANNASEEITFEIDSKHVELLKEGENILAIEGHNSVIDSSDFTLDPSLTQIVGQVERNLIEPEQPWQIYIGNEPSEGWKTAEVTTEQPALLPENLTKFQLRYGPRGSEPSTVATPTTHAFADSGRVIHRVILQDLNPDTPYVFDIREGSQRLRDRKWFFRTAPDRLTDPVTFVTGGDMYYERKLLDEMNRRAGLERPLFALLGGDLAYANGKEVDRWYEWIDSWHDNAVTADDYLIPMIAVIGNHECIKTQNLNEVKEADRKDFDPRKVAKFYYSLFPLPQEVSNYVIDFGNYLSIACLDSYHTQTPKAQTEWLESTLKQRTNFPHLFACYHRPAYGTLIKDDMQEIRKEWVPLFEKYGVDVAFENDHHVYKRTMPIKHNQVDISGVTYMGDGAWGVGVRKVDWAKLRPLKYIARAEDLNHLIRVKLYQGRQQFEAIDGTGKYLDSFTRFD
ncbi:MAG: metallophosphoesterase family protein, partial [Verrucomicrobiales bacterium]